MTVYSGSASEVDALIDLRDLWRSVVRSRWLVVGIAALTVAAAGVLTVLQEQIYESEATIFVAPVQPSPGWTREVGALPGLGSLSVLGQSGIATEAAVLQSRNIVEAVVESLALHVRLAEPRSSRDRVFRVISAPRNAAPGIYELRREAAGVYAIRVEHAAATPNLPSHVEVGVPVQLGDVTLVLADDLRIDSPAKLTIAVVPFDAAVREIRSSMEVSQASAGARVLGIRARNPDSVLAAAIPNAVSQSFIAYRTNTGQTDAHSAVAFLREQVANYAVQLGDAEARLQVYQEQAGVVSPTDQVTHEVRQVADIRARRDMLVAEREAIARLLSRAQTSSEAGSGSLAYRELASFPVFLSNGAVQSILRTLTELENQRAELIVRRTPQNIDVRRIDQRINELELQLYETARSYRDGLSSQIGSLDEALSRSSDQLATVPAQHVTYARLAREKKLLEEMYTLLQTRLKEAEIRAAEEPGDVRILDTALVPEAPVSPRPALNITLGLLLGIMLGAGIAMVGAIIDPKVRSKTDAIAAASGLPVLGMIPQNPAPLTNGSRQRAWRRIHGLGATRSTPETRTALVVKSEPTSGAAEAYRALRTALTLPDLDRGPKVLVICSASAGDGKSTSAANLAATMAQQGLRTLLIDCDLRKPALHEIFGLERTPGLTDVLLRQAAIDDAIRKVDLAWSDAPLDVLPSGSRSPNPAEMVGCRAMRELLPDLRRHYDMLILDAPPLGSAADAAVLGALADLTVLVTRATVTQKRALAEAVAQLRQLKISLGGLIINDVDPTELSYAHPSGEYSTNVTA